MKPRTLEMLLVSGVMLCRGMDIHSRHQEAAVVSLVLLISLVCQGVAEGLSIQLLSYIRQ